MIINNVKKASRHIQEYLERGWVGSKLQECIWRSRHLYNRNWAAGYLETIEHPHRAQVVAAIQSFNHVESVLEIGCASGANLVRLRRVLPNARLMGVDINRRAIAVGKYHFAQLEDRNISLVAGRIDNLRRFSDKSVDVVLSDAVLMFVAPNNILKVLGEMCRVARNGIVINEYYFPEAITGHFDGGRWAYDFPKLINTIRPSTTVTIQKSRFTGGIWDVYGALISVRL